MALMKCPECDGKVSDQAYTCPHCGFPIEEYLENAESFSERKKHVKVELNLNDPDENDPMEQVTDVNGIMVNLGNLIASNYYEVGASSRMLNSITKVGIVSAKSIIEDFLEANPGFNKAEEINRFIAEQAELTRIFRCDRKIANLQIDSKNLLFRLGIWSYIHHFSTIRDIRIEVDHKNHICLVLDLAHENDPTIQINLPTRRAFKDIVDFKNLPKIRPSRDMKRPRTRKEWKPLLIPFEESMEKARTLKAFLEELRQTDQTRSPEDPEIPDPSDS